MTREKIHERKCKVIFVYSSVRGVKKETDTVRERERERNQNRCYKIFI